MTRAEREWRIRLKDSVEQNIRHESWQDDLQSQRETIAVQAKLIVFLYDQLDYERSWSNFLGGEIQSLKENLAEKEAEIVRLHILLEGPQASKKRPLPLKDYL